MRLGHDEQDVFSIERPFCNFLLERDLLVGFLADVAHVPDQNGVFGLFDFKSYKLLIATAPGLFNFLGNISGP